MSIHDELMERIGSYSNHRKAIRMPLQSSSRSQIRTRATGRFYHKHALRRANRHNLNAAPLTKDILLSLYNSVCDGHLHPIEVWSDPDTNDQISRLLIEAQDGSYDHQAVINHRVRLGEAAIYNLPNVGHRYSKAGIFLRHADEANYHLNLRIINYLLPFSIQPDVEVNMDDGHIDD